MPLVKVRYKSGTLSDEKLEAFGPALCSSVARHFNCPGGELTENDIEVEFDEASRFDVNPYDVVIKLEAKHFPLRDKGDEATGQPNFDARTEALGDDIGHMLPASVSFGLWPKLNNARWYERASKVASIDATSTQTGEEVGRKRSRGVFQPPTGPLTRQESAQAGEKDPDAWDPMTGKRPSDPVNWGWVGPR